ncbi:MAG: PASTA domain-containing protein, partial [Rhodoglobus sp.]
LGSRGRSAAAVVPVADRVAVAPKSARRRRLWWLIAAIALLVAGAATAGWYFGAGPGSQTTIPSSIANLTVDEARAVLEELGLTVSETVGEIDSPTVPVGLVAETDPSIGSQVPNGSEVQLLASTGPKPLPVPAFAGMTEEQARAAIEDAPFTFDRTIEQFDAAVPGGVVIDALAADGTSLAGVPTYGELQKISLVVSVGSLPDLAGRSVAEATAALEAVGLAVGAIREEEFSDTVPQGAVIRAQAGDGSQPVRVGDTVDLITSKGVELVTVPDVVGQTWAEAKPQLLAAGFELDYNIFADVQPELVTVSGLDPGAGELAPKGSTVHVSLTL